jgi:hypothetical protein
MFNQKNQEDQAVKKGFFKRRADALFEDSKKAVGMVYIKDGANFIKNTAQLLNPFRNKNETPRVETFKESCRRFGIQTNEDLHVVYRGLLNRFYTLAGVSFMVFMWALYQAYLGNLFTVFGCLGILSAAGASILNTSFRLAQIHQREWFDFKTFLNNSHLWFPKGWVSK